MAWAITLLKKRHDTDKAFHRDYGLTPPGTTQDKNRPAYGGTCYSPMASGRAYTVTKYDNASVVGTEQWLTTAITDNAFAHPIDGYRASKVVLTTDSSGSVSFDRPANRRDGTAGLTNATRSPK